MQFFDFDLLVRQHEQGFEAHVLRSPDGEARHRFASPFSQLELENLLLRLGRVRRPRRGGYDSDATRAAQQFGGRLYEAVFGGAVRSCFESSVRAAQAANACLRIRLRIEAPDFADVPWEYLYDAPQNRFLVLSSTTSVVRYLELPRASRPVRVGDAVRVAVVMSQPTGYEKLENVEQEWTNLQNAFRALPMVEIERVQPTVSALQACLRRGRTHIFHFIGHGDFDERVGDGLVLFEDENGGADAIPSNKLAVILHNHPALRLAVLNCCEGARTDVRQPFSGVGPALVQQGLPAVVAMQFPIPNDAAIQFAQTFYECLARGEAIDRALVEARVRLFMEEDESFGAPVLYMRSDEGVLFDIPAHPSPSPSPAPSPAPPAPPPSPAPAPLPVGHRISAQTRGGWAGSVLFGCGWTLASFIAFWIAATSSLMDGFSFPASVAGWSRLGIALSTAQAGLFQLLRRRQRLAAASLLSDALSWIFVSGVACGLAAAIGWFMAEPPGDIEPTLDYQYWLVFGAYILVHAVMLQRHVTQASLLAPLGALIGAWSVTGLAAMNDAFGVPALIALLVLVLVQGIALHRATFNISASTPQPLSRVKIALLALAVLLLLMLRVFLPDPADRTNESETATDPMSTSTAATDTRPVPVELPRGPTAEQVQTKGSIEGVVLGVDGKPYIGARISTGPRSFLFGPQHEAVSQTDGYYSLRLVEPGRYMVSIKFPDDVDNSVGDVIVSPGTISIVNIRLRLNEQEPRDWSGSSRPLLPNSFRDLDEAPAAMCGAVSGTVSGRSGTPVKGAAVTLVSYKFDLMPDPQVVTAADGSFHFSRVPWGKYDIKGGHAVLGDRTIHDVQVYPGKISLLSIPIVPANKHEQLEWTTKTRDMTEDEKKAREK